MMDKALLEKAAQCKSADELKNLAAGAGMDISEEKAGELFAKANGAVPLSDEELETVAGGCGKSENDTISCAQCSTSIRRGDALEERANYAPGDTQYEAFYFCCESCANTYKRANPHVAWALPATD